MGHVLGIMRSGDYNPHAFDQPGLVFWLHLPVACARFLLGAMRGEWGSLAQVPLEALVPWARALTALTGLATIAVVHQVGMRWGARHALIAAGLLAVMPMHVAASRQATGHDPLTLFTTLCLLLSLKAHERATPRAFAWAGLAAGLAFATSYGGVLALALPLLAAWMTFPARPSRLSCALASVGAALVTYLVVAPMTWTVASGDVTTYAYRIIGKSMRVHATLSSTTVGGTLSTTLYIAVPAGKTITKSTTVLCLLYDNATWLWGFATANAGDTKIAVWKGALTNYEASTDNTNVYVNIEFEIN